MVFWGVEHDVKGEREWDLFESHDPISGVNFGSGCLGLWSAVRSSCSYSSRNISPSEGASPSSILRTNSVYGIFIPS